MVGDSIYVLTTDWIDDFQLFDRVLIPSRKKKMHRKLYRNLMKK